MNKFSSRAEFCIAEIFPAPYAPRAQGEREREDGLVNNLLTAWDKCQSVLAQSLETPSHGFFDVHETPLVGSGSDKVCGG